MYQPRRDMLDFDEDDLQDAYDEFIKAYAPKHYEVTDENREIVKAIDPKFVWTAHSTCENDFISPGFLEFSPTNCCWHEQEWLVSEKAWESDDSSEWVQTSMNTSCPECNPENDEDLEEGNPDCTICSGDAHYTYYAD
jgi:hypothetical protein